MRIFVLLGVTAGLLLCGCGNSGAPISPASSGSDGPVRPSPPNAPGPLTAKVDGSDEEWPHVATMGSGTAGYSAGSWAYEDYVYDATAGTSGNSGDLAVLQIMLSDEAVRYVAKFNSYVAADPTIVALAVDTDCDDATGGGEWPNGSGISTEGWEFIVQAGDVGAHILLPGGSQLPMQSAASHDTNVIEFDVPRSFADPKNKSDGRGGLAYRHWCYRGAVGLGTDNWSQTTNLMFRNRTFDQGTAATDENESTDTFQAQKQSAALQSGEFADFRRDVDFSLIASRATVVPPLPATGNQVFTRIYDTPDFPNALLEGAHQGENTAFASPLYNGRFQPYSIYVPQSYRDDPHPAPLLPMLHGINSNHRNHGWVIDGGRFWTDVVQANRMILPFPFGRGQESWYEHVGEIDVLAVMKDVKENFNIDSSKQFLSGASMGGLGALKIAQLHPDLFAGLILAVPPMSDRLQGYAVPEINDYDLVDLAGSLRNIPVRNFYGALDPIVPPVANSERFCDKLAELTFDHDCWLDNAGSHSNFYDARFAELKQLVESHSVVEDPAQVTYQVHPVFRRQAAEADVAALLPYDFAYWISGIVYPSLPVSTDCPVITPINGNPCEFPLDSVAPRDIATIDVRSYGGGAGNPVTISIADDPSPILVRRGTERSPGVPFERRNAFDLLVENIVEFNLDIARMGLTLDEDLTAKVSGNGTARLGLLGSNGKPCSATLNGMPIPLQQVGNLIRMELHFQEEPGELSVHCHR